jgi:hypothetical protein
MTDAFRGYKKLGWPSGESPRAFSPTNKAKPSPAKPGRQSLTKAPPKAKVVKAPKAKASRPAAQGA